MILRKPWANLHCLAGAALLACSSNDDAPAAGPEPGAGESMAPPAAGATPAIPAANSGSPGSMPDPSSGEAQTGNLPLNPMPGAAPASGAAPALTDMPATPPMVAAPAGDPVHEELPALLSVRQEHAVVALDGEVYVIGGFTPQVTATVEAFNPETETWRSVAPLPSPLQHANAAAVNGRIYVAGFYLGGSFTNADARVLEYDPAQDAWAERTPMPAGTQRASGCVASFEGKVYVFGGARAGTVTDASVYDVASDTWSALPPLPEPREHCAAGEIGGTLYIASGRAGGITGFQPNTWAFDPAAQTYTPRAPIATPRGGTAGAVLGGRLYIFGGEGNPQGGLGVFTEVEAYDPATDTWEELPPMLQPRHGYGAATIGARIYLPGGALVQGFGAADDNTVVIFEAPAP